MTKKQRIFAAILAVVVCLAMVFSLSFIAVESGHQCLDDHCAICAQIHLCAELLRSVVLTVILMALAATTATFAVRHACKAVRFSLSTPITLKVKLSN